MTISTLIGLEIHVQLKTKSKMFCSCATDYFGAEPNTHTCPVCLGLPGALPVANEEAMRRAIMVGLALNCDVNKDCHFDRKSYYYPDLPKGYQISQFYKPIVENGWAEIEVGDDTKRIRIHEAHQEEDAAKSIHEHGKTLVDFNKSGMPLLEIVSEPDMTSGEEAFLYASKIRQILRYLGVSDCDMEKGSMRCEPTINLKIETDEGTTVYTPLVEVKNIGSLHAVQKACEYEEERQLEEWKRTGEVKSPTNKTTRGWNMDKSETFLQREKEGAADYKYFPEPDIPPMHFSDEYVEEIRKSLPELPDEKKNRFIKQYGLNDYDATILTATRKKAEWFEEACRKLEELAKTENLTDLMWLYKDMTNWINVELKGYQKKYKVKFSELKTKPEHIAEISIMLAKKMISGKIAKDVLAENLESGKSPKEIVTEKGLIQVSDVNELETICQKILDENPTQVEQYKSGKEALLGYFVGQMMKETKGKANPSVVNEILKKLLS
jgi:aspartyl-tRNA(Asn)/glutamyl-tRNA(Gln) amidotransferase subunit B